MTKPSPGPDPAACERLAAAARRVIEQVRRTAAPARTLEEATALLERAAALLEPDAAAAPFAQSGLDASRPPADFLRGTPAETFPYSPVIGPRNPLAPPVHCEMRDGELQARVRFGAPYAGAPQLVHGGVIAAAFDEVLGVLGVMHDRGGVTGMLSIKYRSPTPLEQELRMVARQGRVEGRRVHAHGELYCGDTLTAEAEGIFIRVPPGRFAPARAQ